MASWSETILQPLPDKHQLKHRCEGNKTVQTTPQEKQSKVDIRRGKSLQKNGQWAEKYG